MVVVFRQRHQMMVELHTWQRQLSLHVLLQCMRILKRIRRQVRFVTSIINLCVEYKCEFIRSLCRSMMKVVLINL